MFSRTFLNISCRVSLKSNLTVQKIACHRTLHLACRNLRRDFVVRTKHSCQFRVPVLSATFIRHASDSVAGTEIASSVNPPEGNALNVTDTSTEEDLTLQIPDPPAPPVITEEIVEVVGELKSLGLGNNYPPGLLQKWLEFLHISADLPWWAAIAITTMSVRLLLFPLVIKIQQNTAKLHNIQPQISNLQEQLVEARKMGDRFEVAKLSHELQEFMKSKGVDPLKTSLMPMIQAPIFLSFFWALRGMVQAPVESMKVGGLWWFTDLTVPDPYFLLPILTSVTLAITIETGVDSVRMESMGMLRYAFRALPVVIFPFIINFQGGILCYWVSTNLFSLCQVSILRLPKVREYVGIPVLVVHDPKKLPPKKKFVEGFKDSWSNLKVARELNSRQMYDETVFEQAGRGPVPKTYKFDPTKRVTNAILTKKQD